MKRPFSENADEWIGQEFDRVLAELIDNFIHYLKLNASLLCVCFSLENVARVSVSHNRPESSRKQITIHNLEILCFFITEPTSMAVLVSNTIDFVPPVTVSVGFPLCRS